ncbi:MAG: TetR/AcrR family transcriptional regulator [Ilumatobacteraceae bacterium]
MSAADTSRAEPSPAPRGRPRSKELDASILTATLELAAEVGINGMSMDDLAQRAGVSKASIYRRWPSKELLVIDALRSAMGPLDTVDTGDVGADLRAILGDLVARFSSKDRMRDVLPHLIEVATHDPALRVELDAYTQLRRVPMRTILERGVARGEISPDVDLDTLIDALLGPIIYRRLLTGGTIDTAFIERLLALVVPGR